MTAVSFHRPGADFDLALHGPDGRYHGFRRVRRIRLVVGVTGILILAH